MSDGLPQVLHCILLQSKPTSCKSRMAIAWSRKKNVRNILFGPPSSRSIGRPYDDLGKNGIPCTPFSYSATTLQIFSTIFFREAHARNFAQCANWRLRPGKKVRCTMGKDAGKTRSKKWTKCVNWKLDAAKAAPHMLVNGCPGPRFGIVPHMRCIENIFQTCLSVLKIMEQVQYLDSKMAASATATRMSHISVIFLHGSMARPGSCCTCCVTSRGSRGWEGKGFTVM